tara:strand:+ start:9483 stop:11420 length:1938 start_codon:yes stop_codon:yes gene_type:complete
MGAYSNPKMYYYPDATAFSRSFQSAFKDTYNALSNITAKQASLDISYIADRKKSKQSLDKTVNSAVQNNEKLYNGIVGATSDMMNDWSAGNILQTDAEKADATQTFNNFIIPINNATTAAYDPNYDADADLDHGAEYFVERKNIEEGIRDGRISTDFKWDKTNKKFVGTMSVLDEEGNVMTDADNKPLTFNPEQISTIYGNTNPEARQEIDARYDAEVKGIANQVKTMIKDLNTEDKFRNQSKYRSKDDVLDEFVSQALGLEITDEGFGAKFAAGKVSKETVKNINDYYNNHVDYSPAEKVQMFKQNPALAGLQDKDLLWIADLGFNTQEEVTEYLKDKTGADPNKIQGYVDAITQERTKMVGNVIKTKINEEYAINDLMNKYQAPAGSEETSNKVKFGKGEYDPQLLNRIKELYDSTIQPLSEKKLDFGTATELPKIEESDITGMIESGAGTQVQGKSTSMAQENWFSNIFKDQGRPDQVASYINSIFDNINNAKLDDVNRTDLNDAIASGKGIELKDENDKVLYKLSDDDAKLLKEYQNYKNKGFEPTVQLKQFFNNPASKIVYDDVQYFPNDQVVKFAKDGEKILELNLTNDAEWSQLGEQLANAGLGNIDEINDILRVLKGGGQPGFVSKPWKALDLDPNK